MNNVRIPAPPQIPTWAEKIGLVDYTEEIDRIYGSLMKAEYEKANIWPLSNATEGIGILAEELKEAKDAALDLWYYAYDGIKDEKPPSALQLEIFKGYAISAICELLQVIAVCNKYAPLFDAEKKKGEGQ